MSSESEAIELDPLAPKVEEALLLSGMSATKFGYTHFGDSAFITKMRRGRQFYDRTRDKLLKILEEAGVE